MMEKVRAGGFLIAKIHQVAGRVFNRLLKAYGIEEVNYGQGRILFVLWQADGIPMSELSAKTQLEKSTLTAMIDRLEKEGYVERLPSGEDRRKTIIRGTAKTKALEKKYLAVSRAMNGLFYRGWKDREIEEFEERLERLLDNLVREENGPGEKGRKGRR